MDTKLDVETQQRGREGQYSMDNTNIKEGGHMRVNVSITDQVRLQAKVLGEGNVSRGLRRAVLQMYSDRYSDGREVDACMQGNERPLEDEQGSALGEL